MRKLLVFLLILSGLCTANSLASLRLTSPNGGEKFVVGCDTLITWEGIPSKDTIKIEYSIDNGHSWKLLSNKATGLKYIWKNIPQPPSGECLVKIKSKARYDSASFEPPIEWQRTYGGLGLDDAYDIQETTDGGFIMVGNTWSQDGDVTENKGKNDFWVIKLNALGYIEWQKTFGNQFSNHATSVRQTTDGSYVVAGAWSTGKYSSLEVLKLDALGNIIWESQYSYDNTMNPTIPKIEQTTDGGYIVCGLEIRFGTTSSKSLIVKLNSLGIKEWEKIYSKDNFTILYSIKQTNDGGYITVGIAYKDYLVTQADALTAKFDMTGNLEWENTWGKSEDVDDASSVQQAIDGGYIVCGYTKGDILILNYDSNGNLVWEKIYGGSSVDGIYAIAKTKDDGYVASGNSSSNDGDFKNNIGRSDGLILKLNKSGDLQWYKKVGGSDYDYFGPGQLTSDGGYIMVGSTRSDDIPGCLNKGDFDFYVVKLGIEYDFDQSDSVFSIIAPTVISHNIDIRESFINIPKDSTIVDFITNAGLTKVSIDSIYFRGVDAKAFSLLSGFPKYSIQPSEVKASKFRFVPSHIGLHTAEIVIITQSDTLIQTIQGTGVAKLIVTIKNDSAYAGEIKRLKLVMSNLKPENLGTTTTRFSAKIRFQKTILTPLKKSERNIIRDSSYMNVSGNIGTSVELAQILVVSGLGLVEETTLDIVEFYLMDNAGNKVDFDIETQPGLFKLLGICREGGTRLINSTGKTEIQSIIPNPASDDIEIKVNLIEEGISTVSVYNLNGVLIREFSFNDGIGLKTINLNANDFANGMYFIVMRTPTVVDYQKLMIIR